MARGKNFAMYGFRTDRPDETGWLKVSENGPNLYEIVDDPFDASVFGRDSASKWAGFFNSEEELKGWKFRPVGVLKANSGARRRRIDPEKGEN